VGEGGTHEYFVNFVSNPWEPLVFFLIFAVITIVIISFGVQKGIEKMSKIMMPALAILAVFLMIFVMCQPGAMEGVGHFLVPDFSKFGFETIKTIENDRGNGIDTVYFKKSRI
jgi:NSS family neurotransmitter:Na+ symporter